MFVILNKNKVEFGPIDWNQVELSRFISTQYNQQVSLPSTKPIQPILLQNNIAIYPAEVVKEIPALDEKIDGFTTIIESDKVYCIDKIVKLSSHELDEKIINKRNELRAEIQKKRQTVEWGGLDIKVTDQTYRFDTDRDSQGMIHRTFEFMTQPVNWKLADNVSWVTLTKEQLGIVIQAVLAHIAIGFNKEEKLVNKINSSLLEDLYSFDLDKEWENA